MPAVPFNATVWPAGLQPTTSNAEIVTVTVVSTDTLTITRAQEGSSARTVIVGDQFAATVTAESVPTSGILLDGSATDRNYTLRGGQDFLALDHFETGSAYITETPATSTLEIIPSPTPQTVPTGSLVQVASNTYSAAATGTTTIPFDDTIPQNTEGDQYMTVSIVPKSTTNTLVIQVLFFGSISIGNDLIIALFQDSTANALNATSAFNATATARSTVMLTHVMTAGTVVSTTFNVRAGPPIAGTTTFNGNSGGRNYGAIPKSSIIVWEYKS